MMSDGFVKDVAECKDYAAAVQDFLTALKISGAINIVGNSFGSRVAQCFAMHYPDRVTKLAMTGTGVGIVTVEIETVESQPKAEVWVTCTEPAPGVPQSTFILLPVVEPMMAPPLTDHE